MLSAGCGEGEIRTAPRATHLHHGAVAGQPVQQISGALRVKPRSVLLRDGLERRVMQAARCQRALRTLNRLLRMVAERRSPAIVSKDERAAMSSD